MKWFKKWLGRKSGHSTIVEDLPFADDDGDELTSDIAQNEKILREIFHNCSDIVFRKIRVSGQIQWLIIYLESLVNEKHLNDFVLQPLLSECYMQDDCIPDKIEVLDDRMISIGETNMTSKVSDIVRKVLSGHAAILPEGESSAMIASVYGKAERSIEEPSSEPVIRGPREGFIESISTNMGLLRSRLKTSRLKMESITLGELSQTQVVITYIVGIATESVVEEVRKRVTRIQIDGVIESGYIEEFIEDFPFSPFPQIHSTERPDVVAAGLLEGKVAILVDTSPFALIVPMTFWAGLQASEDYYIRWPIATFVRWIRFIFIFIADICSSLICCHYDLSSGNDSDQPCAEYCIHREPVPFPALIEALLMEIVFEALREAGIRLPKQIGQAISIVGALVIGQAAVQAGIISAPVVIVVSITGIAAFTIPRY